MSVEPLPLHPWLCQVGDLVYRPLQYDPAPWRVVRTTERLGRPYLYCEREASPRVTEHCEGYARAFERWTPLFPAS